MIRKIVVICCFIICTELTSQEKVNFKFSGEVPVSIFTFDINEQNVLMFEKTMTETLDLKKFKFLFVNHEHIRNGIFNVDLRNIGRSATNMSYESYRDIDLYKHIPRIYDLRTIPWKNL